jgi:hypothetical protein
MLYTCFNILLDYRLNPFFFFSFTFFFFNFFLRYDKTGSPFRLCVGLYTTLYKLLLHTFINLEQSMIVFSFSSHILQVGFLLMCESGKKIASLLSKRSAKNSDSLTCCGLKFPRRFIRVWWILRQKYMSCCVATMATNVKKDVEQPYSVKYLFTLALVRFKNYKRWKNCAKLSAS